MPAKKPTKSTPAAAPAPAAPAARRAAASAAPRTPAALRVKRAASAKAQAAPAATPPPAVATQRTVTREDIQVRAYFLALENAGQGGSLDYWLAAERELLQAASPRD